MRIWFDAEGDYLEVTFDQRKGYFRQTANDRVMVKVNAEGEILGFAILKLGTPQEAPFEVSF